MKHFYSHLIDFEPLFKKLEELNLSDEEKEELMEIAHSSLHHTIIDVILSELPEEDKKIFLENIASGDHEKTWQHLNEKVEKIEEKVVIAAEDLRAELHTDIEDLN